MPVMTETVDLYKALATLAGATKACGAKWVIGGSAGLLMRGVDLPEPPRDLDLYCDESSVWTLHEALADYAQDKPELSVTSIYRSTLCHFDINGVQVELVGGFRVTARRSSYRTQVDGLLWPSGDELKLPHIDSPVRLAPLAHELWFNQLRGRDDRVSQIASAMSAAWSAHAQPLAAIELANSFDAKLTEELHARLGFPAQEVMR